MTQQRERLYRQLEQANPTYRSRGGYYRNHHAWELQQQLLTLNQQVAEVTRRLEVATNEAGSAFEREYVPKGIAARVALARMPREDRPWWLNSSRCCGQSQWGTVKCQAKATETMQCYLCSAWVCQRHRVPVGYARNNSDRRMGAGHIRCFLTEDCNERVRYLREILW